MQLLVSHASKQKNYEILIGICLAFVFVLHDSSQGMHKVIDSLDTASATVYNIGCKVIRKQHVTDAIQHRCSSSHMPISEDPTCHNCIWLAGKVAVAALHSADSVVAFQIDMNIFLHINWLCL